MRTWTFISFCISLVKHSKREYNIVLYFMAAKEVLVGDFSGIETSRKGRISYLWNYYSIKHMILLILKRNFSFSLTFYKMYIWYKCILDCIWIWYIETFSFILQYANQNRSVNSYSCLQKRYREKITQIWKIAHNQRQPQ